MRPKRFVFASLGACLVIGVALAAPALRADDPFAVPITPGTGWPEFYPGGTLTFTLHDRVGGDTVTGRYATFEVEMGHLNPDEFSFPGSVASGNMQIQQRPIFGFDGSISFSPHAIFPEEWSYGIRRSDPQFSARAGSATSSLLNLFNRRMRQAL